MQVAQALGAEPRLEEQIGSGHKGNDDDLQAQPQYRA